jgi:hypothetical protein
MKNKGMDQMEANRKKDKKTVEGSEAGKGKNDKIEKEKENKMGKEC